MLASRKRLDDVGLRFEGSHVGRTSASQRAAVAPAAQRISELEAALETRTVEHLREVAAMVLVQETREAEHEKQLADRDNELIIKEAEFLRKLARQHEDEALRSSQEWVSRDQPSSAASQFQPPSPPPPLLCTIHGLNNPPSPAYSPCTPPLSCTIHGFNTPPSPAYSPCTDEPECE